MKRSVVQCGLTLALTLLGSAAFAQYGTVRGKVMDEAGLPLEAVAVTMEYQGGVTKRIDAKTNKKGEFVQVGMSPGTYKFTFAKEGFQSGQLEQRVNMGEPTYLPDIKMGKPRVGSTSDPAVAAFRDAYGKALEAQSAGQLDQAEAALKDLVAKFPGNPGLYEIYYKLGALYVQKQDWVQAEAALAKSIELKADFSGAKIELANVYNKTGRKEKADEILKQAASGGDDPNALFNLGIQHLNQGKYADAETAFKKVAELDVENIEALYYLGTISVGQGKTAEAVAFFEKYLAGNPSNAQNKATAQGLLSALKK